MIKRYKRHRPALTTSVKLTTNCDSDAAAATANANAAAAAAVVYALSWAAPGIDGHRFPPETNVK